MARTAEDEAWESERRAKAPHIYGAPGTMTDELWQRVQRLQSELDKVRAELTAERKAHRDPNALWPLDEG